MLVVAFDIDGVLADNAHRLPFILNADGSKKARPDWETFYAASMQDMPIKAGMELLDTVAWNGGNTVYLLTGRTESHRGITLEWLVKSFDNSGSRELYFLGEEINEFLIMRPLDNHVPAAEYKVAQLKLLQKKYTDKVLIIDEDRSVIDAAVAAGFAGLHFCCPENQRSNIAYI